jgi:NodT family efflux transporter outer membrane factor (OMF) lipoprotein
MTSKKTGSPRRFVRRAAKPIPVPALFATSLLAAALLAGCASTQGLAPATTPADAGTLAASRSLAGGATSATFPELQWWRAFGDPQLDALVAEALADAPSLQAADARVHQAQAQAGLADAARKPTLGASAQYTGIQIPETFVDPPMGGDLKFSPVLMLDFKYAPDLWGGKRAAYQAAVGQARAAEVESQAARVTLAANVASTYIALDQAYAALDVANHERERATRLAELGRQRVEAGIDNHMQMETGRSATAAAAQQAGAAQQQVDALRNALAALLGKGPDRGLSIERPHLRAATPGVPSVLPSELLGHRADVVAARWRVEAAARGIDASKASFKPSVNLSAIVGLTAPHFDDLFGSKAVLGFGGPALSLPIFDGGALRSRLAKSDADYDLAVAAYNQSLVGALREVADALQALRSLDAQLADAQRARDAASAAWNVAVSRQRAGIGNRIDALVAQQPLLRLDQQLAALRAARLQAAVELDRALGGGLALEAPAAGIASDSASDSTANIAKASTP